MNRSCYGSIKVLDVKPVVSLFTRSMPTPAVEINGNYSLTPIICGLHIIGQFAKKLI